MNQQEEEILILNYFRDQYTDFPKGKLVKSESPDFILKINPKKSIGIELTRLDTQANSLFERINATLQNKNKKIGLYRQNKFSAIWLIIYTDFIQESKSFNFQNKLDNWIFHSEFNQVMLFDLFDNKVYPLFRK